VCPSIRGLAFAAHPKTLIDPKGCRRASATRLGNVLPSMCEVRHPAARRSELNSVGEPLREGPAFFARRAIMTMFRRTPAGIIAPSIFILGLFYAAGAVTYAQPVNQHVTLINGQTGKCLTIAGGRSTDNNVEALQFNCDNDPSRTWNISAFG